MHMRIRHRLSLIIPLPRTRHICPRRLSLEDRARGPCTESAVFATPFASSVLQCYVYLASQCAVVVCFFFPLVTTVSFSFLLSRWFGFSIVIPFVFRIAGPSGAGLSTGLTLEGIMMALCGVVVGVVYDKIILSPLQWRQRRSLVIGAPQRHRYGRRLEG